MTSGREIFCCGVFKMSRCGRRLEIDFAQDFLPWRAREQLSIRADLTKSPLGRKVILFQNPMI